MLRHTRHEPRHGGRLRPLYERLNHGHRVETGGGMLRLLLTEKSFDTARGGKTRLDEHPIGARTSSWEMVWKS